MYWLPTHRLLTASSTSKPAFSASRQNSISSHPPTPYSSFNKPIRSKTLRSIITQKKIAKLAANGGGDGPEAVLDGIYAACKKIEWRKHSRKVAVLIGDAPPHGVGAAGDGFPQGCPCKETIDSVSSMAEQQGITLYAISLNPTAQASFKKLAQLTGGDCFESSAGDSALSKIQGIIKEEFSNLELDRKVLEAWEPESTYDVVAEKISASSNDVLFSYMRLCRRGLIEQEVLVEA